MDTKTCLLVEKLLPLTATERSVAPGRSATLWWMATHPRISSSTNWTDGLKKMKRKEKKRRHKQEKMGREGGVASWRSWGRGNRIQILCMNFSMN